MVHRKKMQTRQQDLTTNQKMMAKRRLRKMRMKKETW
jgi:hypothetical protein